jgi:hypothetical protein
MLEPVNDGGIHHRHLRSVAVDKTSAERQRRYIQRLKARAANNVADATAVEKIMRQLIERVVWAATGRSPSPKKIEAIAAKMKARAAAERAEPNQ